MVQTVVLLAAASAGKEFSLHEEVSALFQGGRGATAAWIAVIVVLFIVAVIIGRSLVRSRPSHEEPDDEAEGDAELPLELDPSQYGVLSDVFVPRAPGSREFSHISHVVVCRQGVFVIDVKRYRGDVFGEESDTHWARERDRRVRKFPNPLFQNQRHVRALAAFLQLPQKLCLPMVAFGPEARLLPPTPSHVLMTHELTTWIESHQGSLLDENDVARVWKVLSEHHARVNRRTLAPGGV